MFAISGTNEIEDDLRLKKERKIYPIASFSAPSFNAQLFVVIVARN
jgi:hypothetical protein